ncbi:hypothetical protein J8629_15360 [Serratia fonticola]|uniref:hypothetical protein n=1 Tax=Serratia fonticola TaxID=47917 RepID=UPI001AE24CCB|nr:hypothetical protein [Serratia fonticola]MBP0998429.1 hypothetical protein [Serratia fonticola]
MNETNHPSSLATCTLIQDLLNVKDGGIYEAVVKQKQQLDAVVAERDALAAENCIQDCIITAVKDLVHDSEGVIGWHLNGDVAPWDEVLPELSHSDTPATSAALAEVEAKAIEKFADTVGEMYQPEKPATVRARTIKHIVFLATHYAKELREAR